MLLSPWVTLMAFGQLGVTRSRGTGCPLTRRHPRRRISFKGSLSEAQVRESSLELLKGYLGDIVDAIVGSVEKCPLPRSPS